MAPRLRAPSIAAISLILLSISAAPAHAQNAAAEALFSDAERLLKEGKVAEACEAFEGSNRLEPRAGTLINLGLCREQNQQLASAWSAFKDALTRVKDPKKKQLATARVAAIEPKLSYLTISVPDESRVEGLTVTRNGKPVDPALWNRAVPVNGGSYKIGGSAPGHEEWSTTVDVPLELGKISVEVPRFKEITKLVEPPPPPPPSTVTVPPPAEDRDSPSMFTGKRKLALGVAGVGVLAVGAAIVLGTQANGFQDDAYALCPSPSVACTRADEANDLMEKGRSRALGANIAYGVGGAAVIGAAVLWFTGAPSARERRVSIKPRANGLDLAVRF
ncbi:MAG: hypothetical protein JNL83_35425 [Myxococcales bacterium]|nr:hypothetical protein [Myxococcales bacterium]